MRPNKAFTLIELLVVIAIIGILSAVVLASLNLSRHKADRAAYFTELKSAMSQAELFYASNNNKYLQSAGTATDLCNPSASANGVTGIYRFGQDLQQKSTKGTLNSSLSVASQWNMGSCHASADGSAWAMDVPYYGSSAATPVMYCVDSMSQNPGGVYALLAAGSTSCAPGGVIFGT